MGKFARETIMIDIRIQNVQYLKISKRSVLYEIEDLNLKKLPYFFVFHPQTNLFVLK